MRRASWLQLSGFPKVIHNPVEDLPFDGLKFTDSMDEYVRTLKDSRATYILLAFTHPPTRGSSARPRQPRDPTLLNSLLLRNSMKLTKRDRGSIERSCPYPSSNFDGLVMGSNCHPHPLQLHRFTTLISFTTSGAPGI